MKRPYSKTWEPFDRAVISFSMTRSKPRVWYYYNRKSNNRAIMFAGIEKVKYKESKLYAWRFTLGPFSLMMGW